MSKSTQRKRKIKAQERAQLRQFFIIAAVITLLLIVIFYFLYR